MCAFRKYERKFKRHCGIPRKANSAKAKQTNRDQNRKITEENNVYKGNSLSFFQVEYFIDENV